MTSRKPKRQLRKRLTAKGITMLTRNENGTLRFTQTANPFTDKAKGEKSGEGKAESELHSYTKATLCFVAFGLFGKQMEVNGKPRYISAMTKSEVADILTSHEITSEDISLAILDKESELNDLHILDMESEKSPSGLIILP